MLVTYLPCKTFEESVKLLSEKDRTKSMVHANQIIRILERQQSPHGTYMGVVQYFDDPFVKLWEKHLASLKIYFNTFLIHSADTFDPAKLKRFDSSQVKVPIWMRDSEQLLLINNSHQALLLRESFDYYKERISHDHHLPDDLWFPKQGA